MKNIKSLFGAFTVAVATLLGLSACQENFKTPGLVAPVATITANTTIADLKASYWDDAANYIDTVKLNAAGEHIVIGGRVISSDASGNVYKNLVIQDATGAMTFSINANSLYNTYQIGQEILVDVTDMYIGKYSTLQQFGFPDFSAGYGWQATFMPLVFFQDHAQLNGFPEPEKCDTLTITIPNLSNDAASLRKYQSQLVRINNVHFTEGGQASFCTAHKENTNRTIVDVNGNELIVRTSGYANFWSMKLPEESGDIVGILGTYQQSGQINWQLTLVNTDGLMNFGNPTLPKGTETNPFDILDAVKAEADGQTVSGWFTGYIVGTPGAGVQSITSESDIQWTADEMGGMYLVGNAIIVGQTPEAHSLADVVVVQLPDDTPFQTYGNLFDHPENYQKQIWLKGKSGSYLDFNAIIDNSGAVSDFRIEGVTIEGGGGETLPDGDGTKAKPYNTTQVVAMGTDANVANVWVTGYIVGWVNSDIQNYADENNTVFTVPATIATNVLIADDPNEKDYSKCAVVNLPPANDIRKRVNLVDNPGNLGKKLSVFGTIRKYFNMPGVRDLTDIDFDGTGGGGDTPSPVNPVTSIDENFANGKPAGWEIVNVSGNKDWYFTSYNNVYYAMANAYSGTPGANGFETWLITAPIDINNVTNKVFNFDTQVGFSGNGRIEVYVMTTADPNTATKTKLNANIPEPTGSWGDLVKSGDLSLANFNGTIYIGFCYKAETGSNYAAYRVTNVKLGESSGTGGGGGGGNEDPPVGSNSADFNTLTAKSSYSTYTTTDGWVCVNCAIQQGSADSSAENNPTFGCIGGADVRAVCMNGKNGSAGSITSPSLSGGIKTLSFKYGFMFAEGNLKPQFTVNIKQGGTVVATETYVCEDTEKFKVQDFSMTCNVSGNFVIEIVNDCAGKQTSNKERISIWNLTWSSNN